LNKPVGIAKPRALIVVPPIPPVINIAIAAITARRRSASRWAPSSTTHLPLQKWFLAIMLMLNAKKGLSALQLSRDLDVNKNTAWRIVMQIRKGDDAG